MKDISLLILNGPGLTDLSDVLSDTDASLTLEQIQDACHALCESLGVTLDFRQTDEVSELDHWIREDAKRFDALIINPHAGAASSVPQISASAVGALADVQKPLIELHIENIFRAGNSEPLHEPGADIGLVCGLGVHDYQLAIRAIVQKLRGSSS